MSSADVPLEYVESKAPVPDPEHPSQRLHRGVLGLVDIATATMANIGPAMSFYFGFSLIATTAGVASPLTIIAAGIAIALLGNTLAEFSKAHPSTGSLITFVGKSFGANSAITAALVAGIGYIIAMASVVAISGGFTTIVVQRYLHTHVPWPIFTLLFVAGTLFLMVRGVHLSTRWAGLFFAFEMLMLLIVSVAVLIDHAGHLTLAPFSPANLSSGWKGLGLGFPLAVYLFIGWENSAALAEETDNPRRNVPRAVFASIVLMAASYLLFSYVTVEGFDQNVDALAKAEIPFISVADNTLQAFAFFAYLAGLTSTLGVLIAGVNAQARMVFNAGREGLLPAVIGRVHPTRRTPVVALCVFLGFSLLLVFAWGGRTDPLEFFAQSSTLGTILVLVVYLVANLGLPVYYRRYRPAEFSAVRHAVLPLLGVAAIAFPLYELVKPGQPAPYNRFPLICAAIIVLALVYGAVLARRRPGLADRVGSIVADSD